MPWVLREAMEQSREMRSAGTVTAQTTAVHLGKEELSATATPPGLLAASRCFALFFLTSTSSLQHHALPSLFSHCIQAKLMKGKRFPSCSTPSASWDFRIQLKVLWSRLQTHLQCNGIFALIILICFILRCFL